LQGLLRGQKGGNTYEKIGCDGGESLIFHSRRRRRVAVAGAVPPIIGFREEMRIESVRLEMGGDRRLGGFGLMF
jgi:hypothetical protein